MAAAVKALNARIRANPVSDYLCSTHFWGPASNFGIPIAAVMDTQKDPSFISGPMTLALIGYSGTFMRYALAVTPKNWLLFGCHVVNFSAQSMQGYRYLTYHNFGGKEKALEAQAKNGAATAEGKAKEALDSAKGLAKEAADKVKAKADQVKS